MKPLAGDCVPPKYEEYEEENAPRALDDKNKKWEGDLWERAESRWESNDTDSTMTSLGTLQKIVPKDYITPIKSNHNHNIFVLV